MRESRIRAAGSKRPPLLTPICAAASKSCRQRSRRARLPEIQCRNGDQYGPRRRLRGAGWVHYDLISAERAYGGMLSVSNILDTDSGNPLAIPTDDDTGNVGAILTENTQVAEEPLVFGSVALGANTYTSGLVRLSQELIQDTAFDLSGFLTKVFGERLGRITNTHFTTGDGVSKPSGVMTEAVVGVTAASATSFTADELIDLEHSVDRAYRLNAQFMLNDDALRVVKKLKDGAGRYVWLASPADGEPDTTSAIPTRSTRMSRRSRPRQRRSCSAISRSITSVA